jgi:predicted nucleic acid-binding protein
VDGPASALVAGAATPIACRDAALDRLGQGEREAITLAEELHADAILIDERDGLRLAERRHLTVIGTLQILVLTQLQKTNFRVSARLLQLFLDRDAERQEKKQEP